MPRQDLRRPPQIHVEQRVVRKWQPWTSRCVRVLVALLTLATTCVFAYGLYEALALGNGGTLPHFLFLSIATLAFSWMAFGAVNALIGAVAVLTKQGCDTINPSRNPFCPRGSTALIFPVYQEDPNGIASSIRTLVRQLEAASSLDIFDIFILSDSQDPIAREAELGRFGALAAEIGDKIRIVYRNREENVGKKAGNVADWVQTFGGAYPYFVVFDADSVMSARTLRCLVATINENPDTGLIQTVPRLVGARTVFGQLQQFANNTYGPLSAAGLAVWQDASGNYWGHNAIIRTEAFAAAAGLPELPGAAPFGGHIRSHDFVEAALLRRAGWRVALMTSLEGSYEGAPPTLLDTAVRDRRWMQGNLQHAAILFARGLTPISRLHLMVGILSYLSSTLWLGMILSGLWLMNQEEYRVVRYFPDDPSLFPQWPVFDPEAGLRVLLGTVLIVLLPKLLGLVVKVVSGMSRSPVSFFLAMPGFLLGWVYEVLVSALFAPVFMLMHVRYLIEILFGHDSGWKPQKRQSGGRIPFGQALRFHFWHVVAGAVLAVAASSLSWHAFGWLCLIVLGLVLSPVLTWFTSREPSHLERAILSTEAASGEGANEVPEVKEGAPTHEAPTQIAA
jgi:membrane glycosyltransferase